MQEQTKPRIGRFIDPLSDYGFKNLFGSEPNKDLLIAFLNELFKGQKHIIGLTYNNTEHHGPQTKYRSLRYDLVCTNQDGAHFIIEMQRVKQKFFRDRAIYYTSALINEQGPKGDSEWDFKLQEVYLVGVMDFCFDDTAPDSYLRRVHLTDEVTGKVFYEKLGYTFLEIPQFNKTEEELETDLDKWLYLLKNLSILDKIPVFLNYRIFKKLFTISEVAQLSKEEYMLYERDLIAKWNEYANYTTAKEDGLQEGREVGLKEGREVGLKEGQEQVKTAVVKKMLLADKFTIAEIADFADVTKDFVEKVKKTLN